MKGIAGSASSVLIAKRRRLDRLFGGVCLAASIFAVFILIGLVGKIIVDGIAHVNFDFILKYPSSYPGRSGILSPLIGSFWIMILTVAIAVPMGVAAAVYLEEFQTRRNRMTEFIQLNIANLSGVPSIVFGMLGLTAFVLVLGLGRFVLAGALTMAILILPTVILISQEALKAVPKSYREGALALGLTKGQTIRRMVLPNALPGILTGVILSASRAVGETAPLIVVGAIGMVNFLPDGLQSKYTVLPIQIFSWVQLPQKEFHDLAASAILVLMAVLLVLNSAAIIIRARAQKKA